MYIKAGRCDLPVKEVYGAYVACISAFTPVVHRAFWARWLYLERALELASQTGDLLFAAIVLRTMAEDVWALRELARFEDELERYSRTEPTHNDLARIRRHGDLLWSRFLPPSKGILHLPDQDPPKPFEGADYGDLRQVFHRLNDYVHPNYGSHLLALFPEEVRALEVLLDSYIQVYEEFFKVPWVERQVEGPFATLPPIVVRPLDDEITFLQSDLLPEIQQHRARRGLGPPHADPAPNLRRFISTSLQITRDEYDLSWQVAPDWFKPLRSLGEFLYGRAASEQQFCSFLLTRYDIGIPQLLPSLRLLAGARRSASELEQLFPQGRPDPAHDFPSWLAFCQKGLELVLTTTQYKIDAMSWALIRQVNDRNPIGSILAMRSLIEHYAVVLYLGQRLAKGWQGAAKQGRVGRPAVEELVKMEENIARFLAGTKGTEEDTRWWRQEWMSMGLAEAINLRSATEKGLAQDVLGYLYNFGSDVVHGRKGRGIELCPPTDTVYLKANLSRAVLALDLLSNPNHLVRAMRVAHPVGANAKSL
jgi:hypothetical protein